MFPLGNVVLPGEILPLRVFEPRYRQLVIDCLRAEVPEFGVALIERGSEVGGGDQRASIGTRVSLRTVAPVGDGNYHIVTAGLRRLTVLEWLPDDPYPVADVEEWPDQHPESAIDVAAVSAAVAMLAERVHGIRELAARLPGRAAAKSPSRLKVSTDLVVASYQLAAAVPLGAADRFGILQAPTVAARLDTLGGAFDDVEAALRFQLDDSGG